MGALSTTSIRTRPRRNLFHRQCLFDDIRLQSPFDKISWHERAGSESGYSTMAHGRRANPGRDRSGGYHNRTGSQRTSSWTPVPTTFRKAEGSLLPPWSDIFGPLQHGKVDDLVLVGQCGQSIDARIATPAGHSHYINGEAGLIHLHRLRALVDAVVIGAGTALADDPQLTVRRVEGPNPARVIIDPNKRLPPTARALAADGARRLVIGAAGGRDDLPPGVEIVPLAP